MAVNANVFINEFHYFGTEDQFIEIAGAAGTDLEDYKIYLYDGASGTSYKTIELKDLVDDTVIPNLKDGLGVIAFDLKDIDIQDADGQDPDGIALAADNAGTDEIVEFGSPAKQQFISYGGKFTASGGPADTLESTDIGVEESATDTSLYVTGTNGDDATDFTTWLKANVSSKTTKGQINDGQTIDSNGFTGGDDEAPEIVAGDLDSSPVGSFERTDNFVITFNNETDIKAGKGNITIFDENDNEVAKFDVANAVDTAPNDGELQISGNKVTLNPTDNLTVGNDFYIKIDDDAILDIAGNAYEEDTDTAGGNDDKTDLTFNTQDVTGPAVESISIEDDTEGVDVDDNIVITFNEELDSTVTPLPITITDDTSTNDVTADVKVSGNQLIIDPQTSLAVNNDYSIDFSNNSITVGDKIDPANNTTTISTDTDVDPNGDGTYSFTTIDQYTVSDEPQAGFAAVDTNLVITYDEDVKANVGNIIIRKDDGDNDLTNDSAVETIPVTDTNRVKIEGNQVTINPNTTLDPKTDYYVTIDNQAFADKATGQNFKAGINDNIEFAFTTVDETDAPTLDSDKLDPANKSENVAIDSDLTIKLKDDSDVESGKGKIFIKNPSDSSDDREIDVDISVTTDDGSVTVNTDGTITINPTNPLEKNTEYFVEVEEGAFTDEFGNDFAGITGSNTFSFTTANDEGPVLVSSTPSNDATKVPNDADIVLTFNESVQLDAGTNGKKIVIKRASNDQVVAEFTSDGTNFSTTDGTVTISTSGKEVTINPTANLLLGTEYKVEIEDGALTDGTDTFDGTNFNFTTASTVAPVITAFSTDDDTATTDVDENKTVAAGSDLTITFNENVVRGSGNITIFEEDGTQVGQPISVGTSEVSIEDNKVTIETDSRLEAGKSYYVQINQGAFRDGEGENFAGINDTTTFAFTTAAAPDTDAPTAPTVAPESGTEFTADGNLVLTFNEPIQEGTGDITLVDANGTTIETFTLDGDAATATTGVTINGSTITIDPSADLAAGTGFSIQIGAGAVADVAGNPIAAISGNSVNFTTVADPNNPTPPVTPPVTPPTQPTPINDTDVLEGGMNSGDVEVLDFTNFAGRVTADYEVNRSADFNNNVYFFTVDDANGTIDGIAPTAGAAYLSEVNDEILSPKGSDNAFSVNDGATDTGTVTFDAGAMVAPLIVINGDINDALAGNAEYYVPFSGSGGSQNFDQIQLNGSTFNFEDAPTIDQDFNDITISFSNFQNIA